jgi:hypothetical protein
MAGPIRHRRPHERLAIALVVALVASVASSLVVEPRASAAASPWTGSVDLYVKGAFTTQKTWLWCTAADIQIIRNMVRGTDDHTKAGQRRYFDWMRKHNRYDLPVSAGVDPQGWTAGMRHFVDDRYRLVASRSFDDALRLAVIRMRKTSLPVGVTVSHGGHAWILAGFSATADPLGPAPFKVTSVRVVGPLWGLQSSSSGYDMRPNTKLTVAQFKRFFTPWRYAPKRMIWDGRYVSIQPVTSKATVGADQPAAAAAGQHATLASATVEAAIIAAILPRLYPRTLVRARRRHRRGPRR